MPAVLLNVHLNRESYELRLQVETGNKKLVEGIVRRQERNGIASFADVGELAEQIQGVPVTDWIHPRLVVSIFSGVSIETPIDLEEYSERVRSR